MTDNVESLLLEHLRALRSDVQSFREETRQEFRDIKFRLSSMESHVTASQMDVVRHSSKFDDLDMRIQRIEKRLELLNN